MEGPGEQIPLEDTDAPLELFVHELIRRMSKLTSPPTAMLSPTP